MELGKQIKKCRTDINLFQEELAEKVYVSRQTISNWENNKSYPDVKSLVLLSESNPPQIGNGFGRLLLGSCMETGFSI